MAKFLKIFLALYLPFLASLPFDLYSWNSDFTAWWPFILAFFTLFCLVYAWIYHFVEKIFPFKNLYTNIFTGILFFVMIFFMILSKIVEKPDFWLLNEGKRDLTFLQNFFRWDLDIFYPILFFLLGIHILLKIYKKLCKK